MSDASTAHLAAALTAHALLLTYLSGVLAVTLAVLAALAVLARTDPAAYDDVHATFERAGVPIPVAALLIGAYWPRLAAAALLRAVA